MKKFTALFLVISFIVMNCATYKRGAGVGLEPNQKPGALLAIQQKDGNMVGGELIAVKNSSLSLMPESGAEVSIGVADIKKITLPKKGKFGTGILIGAVSILALGIVYNEIFWGAEFRLESAAKVGAVGAAIGGLFGASMGNDKTIQIERKSEAEIQKIMEDLRSKARVRDFQ